MIENIRSPYDEALAKVRQIDSLMERLPYQLLISYVYTALISLILLVSLLALTPFCYRFYKMYVANRPPDLHLLELPLLFFFSIIAVSLLIAIVLDLTTKYLRKRGLFVEAYLRQCGARVKHWQPQIIGNTMDKKLKDVAVVVERHPFRHSSYLSTLSIVSASVVLSAVAWIALFSLHGWVITSITRAFLLLALIALALQRRVHNHSIYILAAIWFFWILTIYTGWEASKFYEFYFHFPLLFLSIYIVSAAHFDGLLGKKRRFILVEKGQAYLLAAKEPVGFTLTKLWTNRKWRTVPTWDGFEIEIQGEQTGNRPFLVGSMAEIEFLLKERLAVSIHEEKAPGIFTNRFDRGALVFGALSLVFGALIFPAALCLTGTYYSSNSISAPQMLQRTRQAIGANPFESLAFVMRAYAAIDTGAYEDALLSYRKAQELSGGVGITGEHLRLLVKSRAIAFSNSVIQRTILASNVRSDDPPSKAQHIVSAYGDVLPRYPRPTSLLNLVLNVQRRHCEVGESVGQKLFLAQTLGFLNISTMSKYRNSKSIENSSMYGEAMKLLDELEGKLKEEDLRRTRARIEFNYENYRVAARLFKSLPKPIDKLYYLSACRMFKKRIDGWEGLLDKIEKEQPWMKHDVLTSKALLAAHHGDIKSSYDSLGTVIDERTRCTVPWLQAHLIRGLISDQHAEMILQNALSKYKDYSLGWSMSIKEDVKDGYRPLGPHDAIVDYKKYNKKQDDYVLVHRLPKWLSPAERAWIRALYENERQLRGSGHRNWPLSHYSVLTFRRIASFRSYRFADRASHHFISCAD